MALVFKILPAAAWAAAKSEGLFAGSADDRRDGFIHFSAAHQLRGTAEKYFAAQSGLVLVAFDADTLGQGLVWETSRGGDLFPHLYGGLDPAKALWEKPMPALEDL